MHAKPSPAVKTGLTLMLLFAAFSGWDRGNLFAATGEPGAGPPGTAAYPEMNLAQQLEALKTDPQVLHFSAAREARASDPYRPLYHFSTPENLLNDPNGVCWWRGHYHMFYQLYPAGSTGVHWGHAYSKDLVHWKDLPLAIRPDGAHQVYSGQTLAEQDRVIAIYHSTGRGNSIAVASDPLLLSFEQHPSNPVIAEGKPKEGAFQKPFDPTIWKEEDGYYSLSGVHKNGRRGKDGFPAADLFHSKDLANWEYVGQLIDDADWIGQGKGDDSAVPNFLPIGDGKHMFLWFSHGRGGQAFVGTYDKRSHRYVPEQHVRMNYGPFYKGTLHAPSAAIGPNGRLVAVFNVRENKETVQAGIKGIAPGVWYGIMTLFRHYWLADDGSLRMAPVKEAESLRFGHVEQGAMPIPANGELVLEKIEGKAMEIEAVIRPGSAQEVGLHVLRSPDGKERTEIALTMRKDADGLRQLEIDVSSGSLREDVPERSPERGPLRLADDEPLRLRIFIDRSIVEVFANDRQCLTCRVYPNGGESAGVSVFAKGGDARLESLDAWQMRSIWPELRKYESE